jgi:hypothetical protein
LAIHGNLHNPAYKELGGIESILLRGLPQKTDRSISFSLPGGMPAPVRQWPSQRLGPGDSGEKDPCLKLPLSPCMIDFDHEVGFL